MMKLSICQICLRTDRDLKVVDRRLVEFHDELCDFILYSLDPQYCMECAHMLKKLYIFRIRCKNAVEVLKTWKKTKANKGMPAHMLYTRLPQSSIGPWNPSNTTVHNIVAHDDLVKRNGCLSTNIECNENASPNNEIKMEKECKIDPFAKKLININCLPNMYVMELDNLLLGGVKREKNIPNIPKNIPNIPKNIPKNDVQMEILRYFLNDHCYSKNMEGKPASSFFVQQKKSLNERTNTSFSDNQFDNDVDDVMEQVNDENDDETLKGIGKKPNGKNDKTAVTKTNAKSKDSPYYIKKAQLAKTTAQGDAIEYVVPFSKERLIALVQEKFNSCGNIETKAGPLDKQFVIKCLEDKANMPTIKALWKNIHGKDELNGKVIIMLGCIQKRFKHDAQYESVFDIEYLNTEEKLIQEYKNRKMYECYVKAEYKCEICYMGFDTCRAFVSHNNLNHVGEKARDIVCSECAAKNEGKKDLCVHMLRKHEAVYKCKLCPMVTNYRNSMTNHFYQHWGKKYTCVPCGTSYNSCSGYNSHQMLRHGLRKYICDLCGRSFTIEKVLKKHIKAHIRKKDVVSTEQVRCDKCNFMFQSQKAFENHARMAHGLEIESRRTRKPMQMSCGECNVTGNSSAWLVAHYRRQHPDADVSEMFANKRSHLCHICGKGFVTKHAFVEHMNVHMGIRPYACALCPKRFHKASSQYNHRTLHLPPAHVCPHCGRRFRTKNNLNRHVMAHIGNRSYKCHICGKGFCHPGTLSAHVRGVHRHIRQVRRRRPPPTGASDAGENDRRTRRKKSVPCTQGD